MSSTERQSKLLAAEDWTRIYQTFKNADFQSYDFDNLRRAMIGYLRENYPEDFNDYIESSEYLALIDLIAFLGQNLAFRIDLNSRDNFLELAERRESVLRLARLLSYNPKRCQPANGLLKFTSVSTTETIIDSNGRDIANKTIVWNDSTNANWYEQFIKVINASLIDTSQFGKPADTASIAGVRTEQYRFNATNTEVPVYGFSKGIDGRNMNFEIVSAGFRNDNEIYEEAPYPGLSPAFLYRDDGSGSASSNTGFFMHFRQGSLQESTFSIERPSTSEVVDIDSANINNNDVWLYGLDSVGVEQDLWTKVAAVEGNNIIYNSVAKNIRKIYSVLSKSNDRVRLIFSDGVFGDLPQGNFKIYYRTSNGQGYTINPTNIKNVTIDIPYQNKIGKQETLTISLGLFYTVSNSAASETTDSIKENAPAVYYTQNRMITGEDYNVLPLSTSQDIIKIKSVNRISSGISRYFDLKDASGKYSSTNMFAADGIIFKETTLDSFTFSYNSKSDIENIVYAEIQSRLSERSIVDFYLDNYPYIGFGGDPLLFNQETAESNLSTGYIKRNNTVPQKVGTFTSTPLKFLVPNAMVKFTPPSGFLFSKTGKLVSIALAQQTAKSYIWSKVVSVVGDGTAGGAGVLDSGLGPVRFNDIIPTGAIITNIIPKFVAGLEENIIERIVNSIFSNRNFGLRYSATESAWRIISEANINTRSDFSLARTGDKTSQQLDASWMMLFETDGEKYTVTVRGLQYVFESDKEIRFFFDETDKVYDTVTGKTIKDKITVLGINSKPNDISALGENHDWEIVGEYLDPQGYIDAKKVLISFYDSDEDGIVDDPEKFDLIVAGSPTTQYVYLKRNISITGDVSFEYIDNSNDLIIAYATRVQIPSLSLFVEGQLIHIVDEDVIEIVTNPNAPYLVPSADYKAVFGRSMLKFQYIHAANESARLDPSATNIIDVFMLSRSYDTQYRQWLRGDITDEPTPPTSDDLYINYGQTLNQVKAISDEIVYHPVKYKNLFGSSAATSLQAVFKVVKNTGIVISDSDIKTGIIRAIETFFTIENWDFGDTFYFSELSTYIMNQLQGKISNIVIVPRQPTLVFGNLYEIKSKEDEIFVSSATVNDIEIITEITESKINASSSLLTTR
jgi:hypothetical protein